MRNPALAILTVGVLGVALVGCGDTDTDPDADPPTPGTAAPGATGQVAACVAGDWQSTEVGTEFDEDAASLTGTGGAGIGLSIGEDGATTLDLTEMEPITVTGEVGGAQVSGDLSYDGQANATIRTDGEQSGSWQPAEDVDWADVRVTVELTEPVQARPFDGTPIGDYADQADEWTGDVVDVDPVLGEGEYECQGDDTLVLTPSDGPGLTWTFTRS